MSGKLGIQTQKLDRAVVDFGIRANIGVFKSIAPQPIHHLWELKAALPHCKFIYRPYFNTQPLDNPEQRAREVYDAIMPHLAAFPYHYTQGYNETGLWGDAENYNRFTIALSGLLHQTGQKHLAYSFGVGNPPGLAAFPYEKDPALWMQQLDEQWRVYHDGLRAADGLALNQYKLPHKEDRFALLRHRLVQHVLPGDLKSKEIHLTEWGLDREGDSQTDGWRGSTWNWTPEQYAQWIVETWKKIKNEVASAAIFVCGGWWPSFEILDQPVIADAIREANREENPMPGNYQVENRVPEMVGVWSEYARRDLRRISTIVLHHTVTEQGADWRKLGQYHYLFYPDRLVQVCPLDRAAPHCGDPLLYGDENLWSLGLAIVDNLTNKSPSAAVLARVERLIRDLVRGLPAFQRLVGHRELRPPGMQIHTVCPGGTWLDLFRKDFWARLLSASPVADPNVTTMRAALRSISERLDGLDAVTVNGTPIRKYMREV